MFYETPLKLKHKHNIFTSNEGSIVLIKTLIRMGMKEWYLKMVGLILNSDKLRPVCLKKLNLFNIVTIHKYHTLKLFALNVCLYELVIILCLLATLLKYNLELSLCRQILVDTVQAYLYEFVHVPNRKFRNVAPSFYLL